MNCGRCFSPARASAAQNPRTPSGSGPDPSYGNDGIGYDNDFTQRNTTFMTWNRMHLARLLKDAGGAPAHGNQRSTWDAGCRFDHPDPEYR